MAEVVVEEKLKTAWEERKKALWKAPIATLKIAQVKEKPFMKISCWMVKNMCRVNLLPYSWDPKKFQLFKSANFKLRYTIWLISICIVNWALCVFMVIRFGQNLAHNWKHIQRKELGVIIGSWSVMAFQMIVTFNTREIAGHLEIIMQLTNKLIKFRRKSKDPRLWKDFKGAKVMAVLFAIRNAQQVIVGCSRGQRPLYIYSALPHEWRNFFTYFLYCLFTIFNSFSTWMVMLGAFSMINFVETFEYLLFQKFSPRIPPRARLMQYKSLQILLSQYNHTMSSFAPKFLKMYCTFMSITSAFSCIQFYNKLDFKIYMTMPITLTTVLAFTFLWYGKAGKIPHLSHVKVRRMFLNRDERNKTRLLECRCYMYSCRIMTINGITRFTFPYMVRIICYQTIRLLLVTAHRK